MKNSVWILPLLVIACEDPKPTPAPAVTTPAITSAVTLGSATPSAALPTTVTAPTPATEPADFDVDMSHSRLGFSVRHMMVSNTRGEFKKFSGTGRLDEKDLTKTSVNLEIDPSSIDTHDEKRDAHLKSPDFFDVKKFPKASFKSTSVERSGAGYKVVGDLTMHGVTKPVTLTSDALSPEVKDPYGMTRRGTRFAGKLSRKEFGLEWNKALETGGVAVGDEITLDLEVELTLKKTAPAVASAAGSSSAKPTSVK